MQIVMAPISTRALTDIGLNSGFLGFDNSMSAWMMSIFYSFSNRSLDSRITSRISCREIFFSIPGTSKGDRERDFGGGSLGFEKMWRVSPEGTVEKICSGVMGIRRGLIERVGRFDEGFAYSFEDAWLATIINRSGIDIHYVKRMDVEHKPMERFSGFVRWHYRRGEGIIPFRERIGRLKRYVGLRLWSTKNLIRAHALDPLLPLILILLAVSVVVQKIASVEFQRKAG
jgi:GT2 family glycosyltransferase